VFVDTKQPRVLKTGTFSYMERERERERERESTGLAYVVGIIDISSVACKASRSFCRS
jgi:hypothetical protein